MLKTTKILFTFILCISLLITPLPISAKTISQSETADDFSIAAEIDENVSNEPYILFEDKDKRDEMSKSFNMSDGTMMVATYGIPIHVKDGQNKWIDIDNTLIEDSGILKTKRGKESIELGGKLQSFKASNLQNLV